MGTHRPILYVNDGDALYFFLSIRNVGRNGPRVCVGVRCECVWMCACMIFGWMSNLYNWYISQSHFDDVFNSYSMIKSWKIKWKKEIHF